jgi:hypothetical protein
MSGARGKRQGTRCAAEDRRGTWSFLLVKVGVGIGHDEIVRDFLVFGLVSFLLFRLEVRPLDGNRLRIPATLRTMHPPNMCGEDYVVRQNIGFLFGLVRACGRMELSECKHRKERRKF